MLETNADEARGAAECTHQLSTGDPLHVSHFTLDYDFKAVQGVQVFQPNAHPL